MEYRSPRAAFHEPELPARIPGLAEQLDIALDHEQSRVQSSVLAMPAFRAASMHPCGSWCLVQLVTRLLACSLG